LNQNNIGGGLLRIVDNRIIGEYAHCYCGAAKNTKDMSPVYCECSAGWFEKLFSSVFEKPVEVVVKRTILQGDASCLFEIIS
jgi:predicted hydrocarbon binding protein